MGQTSSEQLALLELLVRGVLKRRRAQAAIWDALAELPWTRKTGRRNEIRLVEARRGDLVALLTRKWPTWGEALADLAARGLPPTPEGWSALEDARRATGRAALPAELNRRTVAALVAPHSKATLTERRLAALGDTSPTHDGAVRLRPPPGHVARTSRGVVELARVADALGEVSIPERAFERGLTLDGVLRAVLLIENLGAFCDLPALYGWLFAHVPGWDTVTVGRLLALLDDTPVIHFGDLDPNGVRIFRHLRQRHATLRWFVPSFWRELVETTGQPGEWRADVELDDAPPLVRELADRGFWLEQEPLVVDPRTMAALEEML